MKQVLSVLVSYYFDKEWLDRRKRKHLVQKKVMKLELSL